MCAAAVSRACVGGGCARVRARVCLVCCSAACARMYSAPPLNPCRRSAASHGCPTTCRQLLWLLPAAPCAGRARGLGLVWIADHLLAPGLWPAAGRWRGGGSGRAVQRLRRLRRGGRRGGGAQKVQPLQGGGLLWRTMPGAALEALAQGHVQAGVMILGEELAGSAAVEASRVTLPAHHGIPSRTSLPHLPVCTSLPLARVCYLCASTQVTERPTQSGESNRWARRQHKRAPPRRRRVRATSKGRRAWSSGCFVSEAICTVAQVTPEL